MKLKKAIGPPKLRCHKQSCFNCRYYRQCKPRTKGCAWTSECLLLGRSLQITNDHLYLFNDRARTCDGWKRMPRSWTCRAKDRKYPGESIIPIVVERNPYWYDVHIPQLTLLRLRLQTGIYNRHEYLRRLFDIYRKLQRMPCSTEKIKAFREEILRWRHCNLMHYDFSNPEKKETFWQYEMRIAKIWAGKHHRCRLPKAS